MEKYKILILGLLIIIFVLAGYRFASGRQLSSLAPSPGPEFLSDVPPPRVVGPKPDSRLTYMSADGGFSFRYPPDMEKNENGDGSVTLVKFGPSQTKGTEVYDGLILTFKSGSHAENSIRELAESERQKGLNEPAIEKVGELLEVNFTSQPGWSYSITGQGNFVHYFLPLSGTRYLQVTQLLEDRKSQNFHAINGNILSSLELN